jgi:hypothetical protein
VTLLYITAVSLLLGGHNCILSSEMAVAAMTPVIFFGQDKFVTKENLCAVARRTKVRNAEFELTNSGQ